MSCVFDAKEALMYSFASIALCDIALYVKNKKISKKCLMMSAFAAYVVVVVSFTLLPILIPPMFTEEIQFNLDIGYLFRALSDRALLIDVAGNVMLFVPISILGYLADINLFKHAKTATITSFCISLTLELLQGAETYWGYADFPAVMDVNDLITNTIGGLIGYYLIASYCKKEKDPV